MRRPILLFACAALVLACQSTDGPPQAAGDPGVVRFSNDPISGVGGVSSSDPAAQLDALRNAPPGALRLYEETDGDKVYGFKPDGKTTPAQLATRISNLESLSLDPAALRKAALQVCAHNGIASGPDAPIPARRIVVCQLKEFAALVKPARPAALAPQLSKTAVDGGTGTSVSVPTTVTGGSRPPAMGGLDDD